MKSRFKQSPSQFLTEFCALEERIVAGVMSGTSMDGIDVAIVRFSDTGTTELLGLYSYPYPEHITQKLEDLSKLGVREVAELNVELGREYGRCVQLTVEALQQPISLIGCHGQTVYHHSCIPDSLVATLQLGDGDEIAVQTGVPVVSDFRTKDIAYGGQGAPLTPSADWIFFNELQGSGAVLNLGGIANITFLGGDGIGVSGFDTGPGNSLLDRATRYVSAGVDRFDKDGIRARQGQPDEKFVDQLLSRDPYLKLQPPKSTGFEMYGDEFVEQAIRDFGRADEDLIATLTLFVARSIAHAIHTFQPFKLTTLILAGGGALNKTLVDMLAKELIDVHVTVSDQFGVPIKAREAMAFALFAHNFVLGRPTSIAQVTGAEQAACLGKLSFPG